MATDLKTLKASVFWIFCVEFSAVSLVISDMSVVGEERVVLTDGSEGDEGREDVLWETLIPPVERGKAVSDTSSPVTFSAVDGGGRVTTVSGVAATLETEVSVAGVSGVPSVPVRGVPVVPCVPVTGVPVVPSVPVTGVPVVPSVPVTGVAVVPSVPVTGVAVVPSAPVTGVPVVPSVPVMGVAVVDA